MSFGGFVSARQIAVIGTGYVGLTAGACLASLGHGVACIDIDPVKIARLSRGEVPILEPGLPELVSAGLATGRLRFFVGAGKFFRGAGGATDVVFLCLPTPQRTDGSADLSAVEAVVGEIRDLLPRGCVVVNKSTVPVGTSERVAHLLGRDDIEVVSNPEFLREGSAVHDFLNPDRIVVGSASPHAAERVAELYARLRTPTLFTNAASAEVIKYTANGFLAMKLSYVNAIAELCEQVGADVTDVAEGVGLDRRIGPSFLRPGPGWGGSCLPKDTHALLELADTTGVGLPLIRATIDINLRQRERVVRNVEAALGRALAGARIGLLGLTFKAGTDDLRDSPALAVAQLLAAEGADLVAYDPGVVDKVPGMEAALRVLDDPYAVARNAAVLVLLTDWPEFRALDWHRVRGELDGDIVVDTRNHLDPEVLRRAGLGWHGVGRSATGPERRG